MIVTRLRALSDASTVARLRSPRPNAGERVEGEGDSSKVNQLPKLVLDAGLGTPAKH